MQLVRLESEGDAPLSELREVRRRLATLRDELDRRRTWEFDDPVSTLRHDNLSELVDGLRRLKVTLDGVRERRDFALDATELSIEAHRDAWDAVIRDLADAERTPRYGGTALEPIRGLIPLGRDPASGLFEFAHLQSGDPARRDAESGELHLEADTGIVLVLIPGGRVVMGAEREPANPEACCDPLAHGEEGPAHAVILDPFLLSKYEMTQRQWLAASDRNPSHYQPGASQASARSRGATPSSR